MKVEIGGRVFEGAVGSGTSYDCRRCALGQDECHTECSGFGRKHYLRVIKQPEPCQTCAEWQKLAEQIWDWGEIVQTLPIYPKLEATLRDLQGRTESNTN